MSDIPTINVSFEDSEASYLIKFGKQDYLEQIQNGKLRFKHIRYYREFESFDNNQIIGDKQEGVSSMIYPDDIISVTFSHPLICDGKPLDVTKSLSGPISDFPNSNVYIFCLSHFTAKDVLEHTIFHNKYLEESNYHSVLWFLETEKFINNIQKSLLNCKVSGQLVHYLDYSRSQDSLKVFTKSLAYAWQKEARIALELPDNYHDGINQIDDDTIEVAFERVENVIIPIKEFREGFIVEKREADV
jgi:hypothetical protein